MGRRDGLNREDFRFGGDIIDSLEERKVAAW